MSITRQLSVYYGKLVVHNDFGTLPHYFAVNDAYKVHCSYDEYVPSFGNVMFIVVYMSVWSGFGAESSYVKRAFKFCRF